MYDSQKLATRKPVSDWSVVEDLRVRFHSGWHRSGDRATAWRRSQEPSQLEIQVARNFFGEPTLMTAQVISDKGTEKLNTVGTDLDIDDEAITLFGEVLDWFNRRSRLIADLTESVAADKWSQAVAPSDQQLAALAYLHVLHGVTGAHDTTRILTEAMGNPPRATAVSRIQTARKRGFLTHPESQKSRSNLTEQAMQVLNIKEVFGA